MIHIVGDNNLRVNDRMTAHADVRSGSAITFFAVPTVEIVSTVYVSGSFDLMRPEQQSLVIKNAANLTINSNSTTHLKCTKLDIESNAIVSIINDVFDIETIEMQAEGSFVAHVVNLKHVIRSFIVGSSGKVDFDPMVTDMYLGQYIKISGTVSLKNHLSNFTACTHFLLEDGRLTWPLTSDIIKIDCTNIKINNTFSLGTLSFGPGIENLVIGSAREYTLKSIGPINANTVIMEGLVNVETVTINARSIDIKAGSKVSADGVATTGDGTGNAKGSGGQ